MKRLLQICLSQSPTFICAALMTISELVKHKPGIISFKSTVLVSDLSFVACMIDKTGNSISTVKLTKSYQNAGQSNLNSQSIDLYL